MGKILTVTGLNVYYKVKKPGKAGRERVHILKDISFEMEEGEILGLV